ncbi:hypothetical protein [Rhodoferax aquaticus]|uniref:Mor transcription activator domain-containing protein n=1 Tax=Rhodoferax aquaticus TaxID=2527691 RepID=A0A515EKJ6_9BURK|nr:hypothetical protein [Rhodoferax aquaticus]QDL53129.1 hypothetical protein EXZ61_02500 [Rhodoferax aquaticus]
MSRTAPVLTIKREALPESLRELVRVIGEADTLRLIGMHGGARVTVPKTPKAEHPLRMALSEEAFALLVQEYGGEAFDLPKGDSYLRELRHDQVRQCREQGLTVDETAEATGYSRRHVLNILSGHGDSTDHFTMDLFAEEAPSLRSTPGAANDPFGLGGSTLLR